METQIVGIRRTFTKSLNFTLYFFASSSVIFPANSGSALPRTGSSTKSQTRMPVRKLAPPRIRKPQRQRVGVAKKPSETVPIIMPSTPIASRMPSAWPRFFGGNISDIKEKVAGIKHPNPSPEIARIVSSCPKFCVNPQAAVQIPQIPVPMMITFLRENLSAA